MEISYFREFVVLAETCSYWETAERTYVSTSALSKHIKALEAYLGAPLFHRTSRRVELTEFGRRMLPYAQTIAKAHADCEAAAQSYLGQETGTLELAVLPDMSHYGITEILLRYRQDHPGIEVNLQEVDTRIGKMLLESGKCDLALIREQNTPEDAKFQYFPLTEDRLVAVLPASHPCAGMEVLPLEMLSSESFALFRKDTLPYQLCLDACREAGFLPKVLLSTRNLEMILDLVRKGSCVALVFEGHIRVYRENPSYVVIPVAPEFVTTVGICSRRGEELSPAASYFLEYAQPGE